MLDLASEESTAQRRNQPGQGFKILTSNQMLSTLPIYFAQLKAGNNSEKLKNEITDRKNLQSNSVKDWLALFKDGKNFYEQRKFKLDLTDKPNLKDPKKNMALANLSIYYNCKNIKSEYNNNKFKISAPTWNDTFDLPNRSYSIADIQDYFGFIIKKHETLTENPSVQIYPNKIKNRIVFKIKTGYKLELLTPGTNNEILRKLRKRCWQR